MSLSTGDIFEGIYQLEEEVFAGKHGQASRWLADDITAYHKSEVLIDTIPADDAAGLHWKADRLDIKIGQSTHCRCRYIVWPKDKTPPVPEKYETLSLNDRIKTRLAGLIDAISLDEHEVLSAGVLPEYWHYGTDGIIIFYQKETARVGTDQSVQEVKEHWKQALLSPKSPDPISEDLKQDSSKPSSMYWPISLSIIGVLLAVGVYSLRSKQNSALESTSATRFMAFTDAFERGMAFEKKAAYLEAVDSFEKAVREAPASETIDARLDSLARAYTSYAQDECARYQSTGSTQLYFIPNQYYHYAAILARNPTTKTCK
jgi:hypothetical protein